MISWIYDMPNNKNTRYLFTLIVILAVSQSVRPTNDNGRLHRVKRIIGGEASTHAEWPWLVSIEGKIPMSPLFLFIPRYKQYSCGASLINDRWLVTAAHCFGENDDINPRYWKAILGAKNRKSTAASWLMHAAGTLLNQREWLRYRIRPDKIIIHPQYDKNNNWMNDIALMRLSEDVPSGPEVSTIMRINLPTQGNTSFPPDFAECHMAGWGCQAAGGSITDTAHDVRLPKLPDDDCGVIYAVSVKTRICAGHNFRGVGICPGDSGGPLMCQDGADWMLIGIASFTSRDRPGMFPGAFTRVSAYIDWIHDTIAKN